MPAELPITRVLAVKPETWTNLGGFAEGPSWRAGDVFASGSFKVVRVAADQKRYRYLDVSVGATTILGDGSLLIIGQDGLIQVKDGKVWQIVAAPADADANDLTVDGKGIVYFTDSRMGRVFRVTPEGRIDNIASGLATANGIDVDPDSKYLYVAESRKDRIIRYDLPAAGQRVGALTEIVTGITIADGCAFDAWGNLWVAQFGGGGIAIIDVKARKVLGRLQTGQTQTTNMVFAGPNRDELFVTAGSGALLHFAIGVPGFKGHPGAATYRGNLLARPILNQPY